MAIIEQEGLEKLSLRDVARRLGVSHQAPYRHFPSRDHVLAEIVRRAYAEFAAALRSTPITDNAAGDSLAMGVAYVQFALSHPLQYRLMFGSTLPDPHQHSEMMQGARDAFDVLRQTLGRVFATRPQPYDQEAIDREAMFVWSSLHGLVSLLRSDALNTLELSPETRSGITMHALQRIGFAVGIIPAVPT
jgi:AcrR family transcriptional regulator